MPPKAGLRANEGHHGVLDATNKQKTSSRVTLLCFYSVCQHGIILCVAKHYGQEKGDIESCVRFKRDGLGTQTTSRSPYQTLAATVACHRWNSGMVACHQGCCGEDQWGGGYSNTARNNRHHCLCCGCADAYTRSCMYLTYFYLCLPHLIDTHMYLSCHT